MMTVQQQQYAYMQKLRRQMLYRQYYNIKVQRIQNVLNYLRAGGSKDDPEIRDEYYELVSEFGNQIFALENDIPLTKEEQELPK